MRGLLLLFGVLFSITTLANPMDDLWERVQEEVEKFEIGASGSLDIFESGNFLVEADIDHDVERSPSKPGKWILEENYTLRERFSEPIEISDDIFIRVNQSLSSAITFVRDGFDTRRETFHFGDKKYALANSPDTAEKAMLLPEGTLVIYTAEAYFYLGLGATQSWGRVQGSADVGYPTKGQLQYFVFRLPNNKFLLRILAQQEQPDYKRPKWRAGLKIDNDIDLMSDSNVLTKWIDRRLKKLFGLDIFSYERSGSYINLFLSDYIIDLNDERHKQAYNTFMEQFKTARALTSSLKYASKLNWTLEDLADYMDSKLKDFDDISDEIIHTENDDDGFQKLFRATSRSDKTTKYRFHIGPRFFRYAKNKLFYDTFFKFSNHDFTNEYFYYPTMNTNKETKMLNSLDGTSKSYVNRSGFGLFKTDQSKKVTEFLSTGFSYFSDNDDFTAQEQNNINRELLALLPVDRYAEIDWGEWRPFKHREDSVAFIEYFLKPEGVLYLYDKYHTLPYDELVKNIKKGLIDRINQDHIPNPRTMGLTRTTTFKVVSTAINGLGNWIYEVAPDLERNGDPLYECERNLNSLSGWERGICRNELKKQLGNGTIDLSVQDLTFSWEFSFRKDIDFIAKTLAKALKEPDLNKSVQYYLALRESNLFLIYGVGYIFDLLPKEQLDQMAYFYMKWTSGDVPQALEYSFGEIKKDALYKYIRARSDIINNRRAIIKYFNSQNNKITPPASSSAAKMN